MATDPIEELRRAARSADKIDKERADAFAAMLRTEGWKLYEELLEIRIRERQQELLEPIGPGMRDVAEHNKGALYGLIYARDLPRVTVVAMHEVLAPSTGDDE